MTKLNVLQFGLVISMVVLATNAFAQGGILGGAAGATTQLGGNVGISTPPASADANANSSTTARANSKGQNPKTNQAKGPSDSPGLIQVNSKSTVASHIESDPQLTSQVQSILPPV